MKEYLQNYFIQRRKNAGLKKFYRSEDHLISEISKIQSSHKDYGHSLENENRLNEQLNDISSQNQELMLNDKKTEKSIERKRLKHLKWFGVLVEALLSYNGINLFLKETIGITFLPYSDIELDFFEKIFLIVKTIIISIPVAYIFLQAAIHFRYNDVKNHSGKKGIIKYWYSLTWILPVLVIPFLNLFIVYRNLGLDINYIWIFFSFLTLMINIKLVNYYTQFNESAKAYELEKLVTPIKTSIKKEEADRNSIRGNVQKIFNSMMKPAADFRRAYESFGDNKPVLSMNPLYIIFLNRYVYYSTVLPTDGFTNIQPPVNFLGFFSFLDKNISSREESDKILPDHDMNSGNSESDEKDFNSEKGKDINLENNIESSEDDIFV